MTRLPLTLLALGLFALPGLGQEHAPWANKFFTGKGVNAPPVIVHDFGTLPKGSVRTHRFQMTNIYAIPIQVTEPQPSCSCVSVLKYTAKMAPLETGFIDIKIDTSRVDGKKEVMLPIYFEGKDPKTNQPFWSQAKLEIRANSRADIVINPGAVDFKEVPAGQAAVRKVTVAYYGRQRDWKIEDDIGHRKDLFDVKGRAVEVSGAKAAHEFTISLKATAPAGAFNDNFVLKTTDRNAPVLNLAVTGMIQSPLSIALGDRLKMGPVKIGEKLERGVTIRADKPFKVTAVDGQGDGVQALLLPSRAIRPNSTQVVAIEFMPEAVGPVKKVLTIKTDIGESVTLTVEGTGLPPDPKPPEATGEPKAEPKAPPAPEKKP